MSTSWHGVRTISIKYASCLSRRWRKREHTLVRNYTSTLRIKEKRIKYLVLIMMLMKALLTLRESSIALRMMR